MANNTEDIIIQIDLDIAETLKKVAEFDIGIKGLKDTQKMLQEQISETEKEIKKKR